MRSESWPEGICPEQGGRCERNLFQVRAASGFGQIRRRSVFLGEPILPALVKVADIFLITIASLGAYLLYAELMSDFPNQNGPQYIIYIVQLSFVSLGFVFLFDVSGGYSLKKLRRPWENLLPLIKTWILIVSIYFFCMFFLKLSDAYSRLWIVLWSIITLALILSLRGFLYLFINAYANSLIRIVAVIGTPGNILNRVIDK